jgi:hypothetical protein
MENPAGTVGNWEKGIVILIQRVFPYSTIIMWRKSKKKKKRRKKRKQKSKNRKRLNQRETKWNEMNKNHFPSILLSSPPPSSSPSPPLFSS